MRPLSFIVAGLPRSGTTWVSNWLTAGDVLCLHDPFELGLPEDWPRDHRRLGISCTGAVLFPRWVAAQGCPVAVIERPKAARDASLSRLGLHGILALELLLDSLPGRRFAFDQLWREDGARALQEFLLPGVPFDAIRYRELVRANAQPEPSQIFVDASVCPEMLRRELAAEVQS